MASEPDDYQSISDDCPGFMVLIPEGIICTRCAGEKRHRLNDCPKPSSAANLVIEAVPEADPTGFDNGDSGMESLSDDTDSVSSDSTIRSESSEVGVTGAHQFDQGGTHLEDAHLSRRDFAHPDSSQTNNEPECTSASPPRHRTASEAPSYEPSQIHEISSQTDGPGSNTAAHESEPPSHRIQDLLYGPRSWASAKNSSFPRSGALSTESPSIKKHWLEQRNDRTKHRSRSRHSSIRRFLAYEANGDRLPSASLADTTGKFDYSNTTCPSSFGFGRLPSEAMG
ncbi:MAG: hypothetical protein ALECFALPRED_004165 [Alectoria fallacina]|uniref:Uncharacterized protein n=1 Tax=Alectoria fallacina TaxID=1903189 RepID=A0A8H3FQQ0_9LECA|nr:MAG: hypothetical protein ALECFALPRED_004165 [Alectoria fallacina]